MDVSHPVQECCQARDSLSPKQNSKQIHGPINFGAEKPMLVGSDSVDIERLRPSPEDATNIETDLRSDAIPQATANNSGRSAKKEKKVNSKFEGKKYTLRSSLEGPRVLRSRSNGACNTPPTTTSTNSMSSTAERRRNRKKRKRINRVADDELSRIRRRVKYLSARMSYEQSLIEAYSGEGWKRQSVERVRPEKELQRATSEILRCKLEMRDLFQRIDALCAEGKLQESLFDPEGLIDSEDIFCAKCGSKDFSANNDIILCDGACDRGFHQMCLVPPLLNIPPGDEGWLCPGCDCKVDCTDLLNDIQGTDLSIEDKWEKVFPEAASVAAGDKQYDDLGLPSDDSEDDDYDPDRPEADVKSQKESSSSEESDSTSASDGPHASTGDVQHVKSGFSSDDSEDNDYDPDAPELDENVQNEGSYSNESDFSSDTNDLIPSKCDNESSGSDDESSPNHAEPTPNHAESVGRFDRGESEIPVKMKKMLGSDLRSTLERDQRGENSLPVSGKRHREQLDYQKLHDETYGNIPSDSSDDEDWTDMNTPKKGKNSGDGDSTVMSSLGNIQTIHDWKSSKPSQSKPREEVLLKQNLHQLGKNEKIPDARKHHNLGSEDANRSPKPHFMGTKVMTSGPGRYGREVSQRLCESFKVNANPTQETVENLSKELGITVHQVSIWFDYTRGSFFLLTTEEASKSEINTSNKDIVPAKTNIKEPELEAKVVSANNEASKTENSTPNKDSIPTKNNLKKPESEAKVVSATMETSKPETNIPNKDIIPTETKVKELLSEAKVVSATKEASKIENISPNKEGISTKTNGKKPESEAKVVDSLASNEGEEMQPRKDDAVELVKPINQSTEHVTPAKKGGNRVVGSTTRLNSSRYESKKRRQAKLDDRAANEALTNNEKPMKNEEADSPRVQRAQKNGQFNKSESVGSHVQTRSRR